MARLDALRSAKRGTYGGLVDEPFYEGYGLTSRFERWRVVDARPLYFRTFINSFNKEVVKNNQKDESF
jgi:hypothetical protein